MQLQDRIVQTGAIGLGPSRRSQDHRCVIGLWLSPAAFDARP